MIKIKINGATYRAITQEPHIECGECTGCVFSDYAAPNSCSIPRRNVYSDYCLDNNLIWVRVDDATAGESHDSQVSINGMNFPRPESKKPPLGTKYWTIGLVASCQSERVWLDTAEDNAALEGGLVHLSQSAATAHAIALREFNKLCCEGLIK